MARYNSVITNTLVSNTTTFNSPQESVFTTLGGTAPYTVTLPNPVLYPGYTQTYYNSTAGNITLTTPSGTIKGPGITAASSQTMPTLSVYVLTSDGADYVLANGLGGPLTGTTLTLSSYATAATVQGATTASGTLTLKSTSSATKATAGILMTDGITSTTTTTGTLVVTGGVGVSENIRSGGTIYGNLNSTSVTLSTSGTINGISIGATTRSTGAFTTLDANSTVGLSPSSANVTISPTGTGTVTINPATVGAMDNVAIGATTPGTGKFSTMTATTATLTNGTISTTPTNGTDITNKTYVDAAAKKISGFGYFYGAM